MTFEAAAAFEKEGRCSQVSGLLIGHECPYFQDVRKGGEGPCRVMQGFWFLCSCFSF